MSVKPVVVAIKPEGPGHIAVAFSPTHRHVIECGSNVNDHITTLNAHFGKMGWDAVSSADVVKIQEKAAEVWTPEVVAAWQSLQAEQEAEIQSPAQLTAAEKEASCLAALNEGATRINLQNLIKAKAISDEAYRLGKPPPQLTAQELQALRQRIANIYKVL